MRPGRLLLMILTALLLVNSTACDSYVNKKADVNQSKPNNSFKIYYMSYDTCAIAALDKFREMYKDVKVDDYVFNSDEEYKTRLTMDILSGEGPDVILIRTRWFDAVNKLSSRGALCDLNEFIKKDKNFNFSEYNEKVLNSIEQDGKRLFMPLCFRFDIFTASKEALKRNNIELDLSNWNYNELLRAANKFKEENKGKKKYFLNNEFSISNLIKSSGISFVDYKNKKSLFGSNDFIDILQIYKGLYPSICPYKAGKDIPGDECLKNDVHIMQLSSRTTPWALASDYSEYKSIGEEMEVYPFPTLKGENSSTVSYAGQAIGINSQSKNKDAAYNFIKILMSKNLQIANRSKNVIIGAPINKAAYKEDAEYFLSKEFGEGSYQSTDDFGTRKLKCAPLPTRIITQLDGMISKVDKCKIEENEIFKIVEEALPSFLNGRKTAAQTAKEIDDKVNLYLNE